MNPENENRAQPGDFGLDFHNHLPLECGGTSDKIHFYEVYEEKKIIVPAIALAMGIVGSAHARGPQFSLDIETMCDADGNVAVSLTDASDDNGPADAAVGLLTVECLAAVKAGKGKPNQVNFATILIPDPGFGVISAECPLGSLPAGATEWKATATASDGNVRRPVSDTCEEVY